MLRSLVGSEMCIRDRDEDGVVSPTLQLWLFSLIPPDPDPYVERLRWDRDRKLLKLASCCCTIDPSSSPHPQLLSSPQPLSPDVRQSDMMFYAWMGVPLSSLSQMEDIYKTLPLGYCPILDINDPAVRVVSSNVQLTFGAKVVDGNEVAERTLSSTTATVLGRLDQTPFQILLRRVALYTKNDEPTSNVGQPTTNNKVLPNGGIIINHITVVTKDIQEARRRATEQKEIQKANIDRNWVILKVGVVVSFSTILWVVRSVRRWLHA
eukprot:TRINITY_DN37659_c0_g2_i1.p1 TRINITY_DN37659_c0_g2~~TRINITY_DN37659_c0_g2_i1.p1  ORF type:complete len:265 (-),score=26.76 TRINITY_DN37659_c0_g2_i1:202-996(-)